MEILESGEDYLERILMIKEVKGIVHSIDIAHELNFSKPSVSIAMKKLKENGYITMEDNGEINLTSKGYEIASQVYERHRILTSLLIDLGVDSQTAKIDACKIEHDLSLETFNKIKEHYYSNKK